MLIIMSLFKSIHGLVQNTGFIFCLLYPRNRTGRERIQRQFIKMVPGQQELTARHNWNMGLLSSGEKKISCSCTKIPNCRGIKTRAPTFYIWEYRHMINKSEKQVVPLMQSLRKTGGWGFNGIAHKIQWGITQEILL